MAFPILGLLFAGAAGLQLHRRNASRQGFADQFEQMGYDEAEAKHLGRVATNQGVGAAMQMDQARRAYELRSNPQAAMAAHNADLGNDTVYTQTPYGPTLSPRKGTEQWLADDAQTEDMIQHRNLVKDYRDMVANEGRWRGRTPKAAELDAMQQILKVGYAKSLGGPVTESDLQASDALFGAEMASAILTGETNEEIVAGVNVYLDQQGQDLGQQFNKVYFQDGRERDRKRFDSVLSEVYSDRDELVAQAQARAQDQMRQTAQQVRGLRQAATEALSTQPGMVGDVLQSLMLGAQAGGGNPQDMIDSAVNFGAQASQRSVGENVTDWITSDLKRGLLGQLGILQ